MMLRTPFESSLRTRRRVARIGAEAGFTMVEIALSIGVIAFALVAILGVLPTGITVQKDNREETIINQDGLVLMEALKGGARGMDYLTNHFRWIRIDGPTTGTLVYSNFVSGDQILGLLSYPAYEIPVTGQGQSYSVVDSINQLGQMTITAQVRSITGAASQKAPDADVADFDLNYLVTLTAIPRFQFTQGQIDTSLNGGNSLSRAAAESEHEHVSQNFWDVRLQLEWPVFVQGPPNNPNFIIGPNSKSFRSLVAGRRASYLDFNGQERFQYLPNEFIQAGHEGTLKSVTGP